MKSLVIVLILAATVALGALNARQFLRGASDPVLTAVHPVLGIGGLVALVFSGAAGIGFLGALAAGLLAAAVFGALLSAILRANGSGAANAVLVTHAVCGVAGLLAALGWAVR